VRTLAIGTEQEVVYDCTDNAWEYHPQHPQGRIVLTFDDGPSRHLLPILHILHQKNVPAVFFWTAELLHPREPWQQVVAAEHQIGTHSLRHRDFSSLDFTTQKTDLASSIERIEAVTGLRPRYFRPPFGQANADTYRAATELDVQLVMWRVASMDWELRENPQQIIRNVVEHLEDGAIILLHEFEQTLEVLPELIDQIRNSNFEFTLLP